MTVSVRSATNPPLIGFDPDQEYLDIDGVPGYPLAPFEPGLKVMTNTGDIFRFVHTTASLSHGHGYAIAWDGGYSITPGGSSNVDAVRTLNTDARTTYVGIPHRPVDAPTTLNASAAKTYFWMQTAGSFPNVSISGAVTNGNYMNTTATGGTFDDAATNVVIGAVFCQTATAPTMVSAYANMELIVDQA